MGERVVLLTGPAGSGKTTLAHGLADRLGWAVISEDDHWQRHGWGSGLRTRDQEGVVQREVLTDVLAASRSGQSVVLEFVLYSPPPNPLTAYETALVVAGFEVSVVALKPSVEAILHRRETRGRPADLDQRAERRREAVHQRALLDPALVPQALIIDSTGLSVEQTVLAVLRPFPQLRYTDGIR